VESLCLYPAPVNGTVANIFALFYPEFTGKEKKFARYSKKNDKSSKNHCLLFGDFFTLITYFH